MNRKFILSSIARLNMLFAVIMLFPFVVGLIYHEPLRYRLNFLIPAVVIFLIGYILKENTKFKKTFNTRDALTLVAFCWILYSIFGLSLSIFIQEISILFLMLFSNRWQVFLQQVQPLQDM